MTSWTVCCSKHIKKFNICLERPFYRGCNACGCFQVMSLFSFNFYLFPATHGSRLLLFSTSNYFQHVHNSEPAAILFLQWINFFSYRISYRLNKFWSCALAFAIENLHSFMGSFYRCPDILVSQTLADCVTLSQNFDNTFLTNKTHEMNSSPCQRQLFRQTLYLFQSQFDSSCSSFSFADSLPVQRRRRVTVLIPREKLVLFSKRIFYRAKMVARKVIRTPQMIQGFNHTIALRLAGWNENNLNSKIETQPHEISAKAPFHADCVEGGIVVYLQKLRICCVEKPLSKSFRARRLSAKFCDFCRSYNLHKEGV